MNSEMDSSSNLNSELITRCLNFHGQLLQKQWETERGEGDLQKLGVNNLDFNIYSQRQKHLSFQDRGKRLKLHQFITKRASSLFDTSLIEREEPTKMKIETAHFAQLPAFDSFLNLDKQKRTQHFHQCIKPKDVIICSIAKKLPSGMVLTILCVDGPSAHSVADLEVQAFCPSSNLISAVDKSGPRTFMIKDFVACEVLEVMDTGKIICGMKGEHSSEHKARLGLFHSEDFPPAYKLSLETRNEKYEEMLENSVGFHNPSNMSCLSSVMGLGSLHHTNLLAFKGRFPEMEYATELRNKQAEKWALRSVSEGIEHFKAGRMTEAFQCLNRALGIDSSNVEGLVARGALFANSGNFKKAIEDFEVALKLNHSHGNARKYMAETLVAHGRSYEDKGQLEEALVSYEKCLDIIPEHEEAVNSIAFLKSKMTNGAAGSLTDGLGLSAKLGVKGALKHLLSNDMKEEPSSAKKKKKEKKVKKHKRHSSSSSSSSSSGSSDSSSSSSDSDTSSGSSNDSHRKKKHKARKSEPKEKSLSPLSKRMAIMDSAAAAETHGSHYNPPAMPYSFNSEQTVASAYPTSGKSDKESEYEQRVCKFLEQTKGDSDYEEKVRKFLDETAKWKKDRKALEEKAKKKRKKEKKARSKNKKKKRDERKKKKMLKEIEQKKLRDVLRKQRRQSSNVEEDEEFLYGEKPDLRLSLPDLEDLQSKLSYYVKVEKGSSSKKKEKSSSVEKLVAAAQGKAKASSPKVLYLEEEKEEARPRLKSDKKKMDMFEESPPLPRVQEAKNVPLPSAPPPSKFKMQIGSAQNRLKKRSDKSEEKETWDEEGEKRFIYVSDNAPQPKEPEPKKVPDKKKEVEEHSMANTPMVLDKLGGFRINPLNAEKKEIAPTPQKRKLRPRVSDSDSSDSEVAVKKKDRTTRSPASSRSRSRSRSHKKYSSESPPPKKYSSSSSRSPSYRKDRSRSKSGSYRSRSGRRYRSSESGSYRSRSRSRSRSMDYHRRSRSRSDDRHRYHKYPGRYPRNRGTYYRPRFQTGFKTRPGGFFPRGRGGPWRPGNRPFVPRMRGRGRPRFFHNNYKPRDDRYRRYDREMSRSDDDDGSPMRKVDAAKERIDRMLSDDKRHTGPLSEGEERDEDYIDRKDYDRERPRSNSPDLDRSKKEGSKELKSGSKPNPW